MKFNLNVEVTDDELKEYAYEMLLKGALATFGSVFQDPTASQYMLAMLQHAIQTGMRAGRQQRGPVAVPGTQPMPSYPPFGVPPGPHGPTGPGNVRPIRPEGAQVERCFRIEATRQLEEGVCCCHCATYNGAQRTTCRYCGHPLCHEPGPVVTPPQAPQPPPGAPA